MSITSDVRAAVEEPTIENIVDALKAFVGRWDTDVVFQIDGTPVTLTGMTQTYEQGSGIHPPVVVEFRS